jgi:hypothetical protein
MSRRLWRQAEEQAAQGAWANAGMSYAEIAEKASRVKDSAVARQAAALAADAFRRDDRPAAAAKLLMLARAQGADSLNDRVQLASVLMDAGELAAALDIAQQARSDALLTGEAAAEVLARDTLAGLLLAAGRVDEARAEVDAIGLLQLPGGEVARRFRSAQLLRLDGRCAEAEEEWKKLAEELEVYPQAAGAAAACRMERAESLALRVALGSDADLLEHALAEEDRAAKLWTQAGRRAGLYRSEAWKLRLRHQRGETVLPAAIEQALRYATERKMPLLRAELLVCLAVVTGNPDPAHQALAHLAEAPLARGRARVIAAEQGAPLPDALFDELAADAAWTARAMLCSADPQLQREGKARAALLR